MGDVDFDPNLDVNQDGCVDVADFDSVLASGGLAPAVTEESSAAIP